MERNKTNTEWCDTEIMTLCRLTSPLRSPSCSLPLFLDLGSYLTHEASGLDEHGEVQEAFLNGNETSQGKKEYLL